MKKGSLKPIDIIGNIYDNLTVTGGYKHYKRIKLLELKCLNCGNLCFAQKSDLLRGRTKYCKHCENINSKKIPYKLLYENYKRGARARNLEFCLSFDEFFNLVNSHCSYCNYPPKQVFKKDGLKYEAIYNGIDRIDNSIGYISENVTSSCKFCNFAKNRFTESEFKEWLEHLKKI